MNSVLTIASLTIKEVIRRRTYIATILIALILVAWSILPHHHRLDVPDGADAQMVADANGKIFAWFGCGMIKFFSSVLAITLAAGAITTEIDKGVLSVIVPKPLTRASIYLGKWLGLLAFLGLSILLWGALLVFVVWRQTGTFHPHILTGILATCLFPLLFTTLTLCFSTFATNALAAGLSFIAAGIALAQDVINFIATLTQSDILKSVGNIVGYLVPIAKMNHWITKGLGDAGTDMTSFNNPASAATTSSDLIYICIYITAALAIGIWVFQKRDL